MNDVVVVREDRALTAVEIRAQVNLVQEVMQAVMQGPSKENPTGVHYGKIPGTPKNTLYKPGAEKLCMTFRIAPSFKVEDLSNGDCIRYRVTCLGTHQTTGIVMGEGIGEASTSEEKYKWRGAVCIEEFDNTPEDRRRVKYAKSRDQGRGPGFYTANQIRTEPADLANTVLKMAAKRAHVAMTLNVLAASDIFTQDIEDLPEELRPAADDGGESAQAAGVSMPKSRAKTESKKDDGGSASTGAVSGGQVAYLRKKLETAGVAEASICERFKIAKLEDITAGDWDTVKAELVAAE